jgi:alpha-tubulin suppressor-like RCC1 family protein
MALTKDYQLYSWGSNQLNQLGRTPSEHKGFSNKPGLVTAFEQAKPFKIVCGSYHNVCLSYRMPRAEEPEQTEEIVQPKIEQN